MKQDWKHNTYKDYVDSGRPSMWQCLAIGMLAPIAMCGLSWLAIIQETGGF